MMIAKYKGYYIEVTREQCTAGYDLLYYSVTRISDGYTPLCDYEDSAESVKGQIANLKERIDNEHKTDDPWMEKHGNRLSP